MQPKKIGIYIADILYHLGGTETYSAKLAHCLLRLFPECTVTFVTECYSPGDAVKKDTFFSRLNSDCGTAIDPSRASLFLVRGNQKNRLNGFLQRLCFEGSGRLFDLFFYCSRGHYMFRSKKRVAVVHFPMRRLEEIRSGSSWLTKKRLSRKDKKFSRFYDLWLPNSEFSLGWTKKYWPDIPEQKIRLLYPPISLVEEGLSAKENIILACSRIEESKRLEVLMDAYKSSDFLKKNYTFVIAGAVPPEKESYKQSILGLSKDYNIRLFPNATWKEIVLLYSKAKFFWHCKGYGMENTDPYKMEHFGMTTAEAMSAGCVPIVIDAAGQREIVTKDCGRRWKTPYELVSFTEQIANDEGLFLRLSQSAKERARQFSMESFSKRLEEILGAL